MFPGPASRKRGHDADDEVVSVHNDKRLCSSAGREHRDSGTCPFLSQSVAGADKDSVGSTVPDASSSDEDTDVDMDMDMDTSDDFQIHLSQSPDQHAPWALPLSPLRNPKMALNRQGTRIPTPTVSTSASIRPKPMPLQNGSAPAAFSASMRSHVVPARERLPSPISEDEPHTPTTAAGSQLSLLTVTDVDMGMEPASIPALDVMAAPARKQRARSGAFTSPRDPSKKFSMGYREDCDKCRDRVPGHMNHFLGA